MDAPPSPAKSFGLSVAIIIGGLVIALAMYLSRAAPHVQSTQLSASLPGGTPERVTVAIEADDPVLGSTMAPVTIVLFSDFECSYCQDWHQQTLPALQREFLDQGKARLVFKDFPLSQLHPQAQLAAEAAQCAHQQNKFWEYSNLLTQEPSRLGEADLRRHAELLELNTAAFNQCLTSHEQAAKVTRNVQAGIEAGVTGTPAFVINGELIEGAQPIEVLGQAITVGSRQ